MKTYSINLKEKYPFLQGGILDCVLTDCPLSTNAEGWRRPAVIVVPGGGYEYCSSREKEPVATAFLAQGFQAFVLTYLCAPDGVRYPEQLLELSSAVDYVKKHADTFSVNPEEIFVVGFSAGGHLTGNLAIEHQNVEKKAGVALDCKPTAVGLCYPVVSQNHGHQGSYNNLLQGYSKAEKQALYPTVNLNEAVNEQTPPAFIWSTFEDTAVPTDNALRYALALDKLRIRYELHVYPQGGHGLSTGSKEVNDPNNPALKRVSAWLNDCVAFFRLFIKEPF